MKIRTSMGGFETLINDNKVFGHIDEEGWWPSLDVSHAGFFKLTPENLRTIAENIEALRALKKSLHALKSLHGKREVG